MKTYMSFCTLSDGILKKNFPAIQEGQMSNYGLIFVIVVGIKPRTF
jgi:hypothetical protein